QTTIRKSGDSKLTDYLVAAAIGIGALVGTMAPAAAQTAPVEAPAAAQNAPVDCATDPNNPACAVETVVVTGSRIPRVETDSPSPITSVGATEILHSGDTNLTDYLRRIPALVGSLSTQNTSSNAGLITNSHSSLEGLNLLDLRNLGYIRTLVLEDGQRIVSSSPGDAAVDTNTIPITLIDRVDVVTGGSSAVYGADGVSGVVNFIMKHDLEGIDARSQASFSDGGGGNSYTWAASIGHNFDNGNGNVTLTYEGYTQNSLFYTQRAEFRNGNFATMEPNPANPLGSNRGLPAFIPMKNVTIPSFGGIGEIDALNGSVFNGNGNVFNSGTPIKDSNDAIGGDGLPIAPASFADFIPITNRNIAEVSADDQFSRWFKLSGEFRFAHVDTKNAEENPFFEMAVTNQNPFLPTNVQKSIAGNGLAGFGPDGSSIGLLTEFPYLIPGTALAERVSRNVYRGVLGADGDLPAPDFMHDAKWDVHYVYGQTDVSDQNQNDMNDDRLAAAMDVVNGPSGPTCRSNLEPGTAPADLSAFGLPVFDAIVGYPSALFGSTFTPGSNSGCVAYNPFDPNYNNKAAIKWIYQDETTHSVVTEQDLNGFMSFDLPQWKDWGMAAPLSVVLGGEYRQETSKSVSPANTVAGYYGQIPGSPAIVDNCSSPANTALGCVGAGSPYFGQGGSPVEGRFHVTEAFGEANIPVLANQPFAQELTFDIAGRVSDYSSAGTDETWKLDAVWSPISGIKFRGTDAYAVRAPSVGELFSPQQVGFEGVADPCDQTNVHAGTKFREANCIALFKGLGIPYNPNSSTVNANTTPQVDSGGNPALSPETARTQTLGVVLQPDMFPNLSATVDWYSVHIVDAIEAPAAQDIANECVDLSSIANPFCGQITRLTTPVRGQNLGQISLVTAQEINVATFKTAGEDFTINYHANLDDWFGGHYGMLDLHLLGSHLDSFAITSLPGEAPVKSENVNGGGFDGGVTPVWQFNLDTVWTYDQWSFDYNIQWYNSVLNVSRQTLVSEPNIYSSNFLYAPPQDLHSIQISYDIADGWNAYAGVNNLWDQKPQFTHNAIPADAIGRVYYLGLKVDINPW
ncbi:MAG TPA: TonB-dependent receptor, partial [Rhizomicrobium sp.]